MSAEPEAMDQGTGTFVFVDLAGFTALTEAHGDQEAAALVDRFERLVDQAVGIEGRLVKVIGDAAFLAFDSPLEALRATTTLLRALQVARSTAVGRLRHEEVDHWFCSLRCVARSRTLRACTSRAATTREGNNGQYQCGRAKVTVTFDAEFVKMACDQINTHHADDALAICRGPGGLPGADAAQVTDIDGDGIELVADAGSVRTSVRVPFLEPVAESSKARVAVVNLARHARGPRNSL